VIAAEGVTVSTIPDHAITPGLASSAVPETGALLRTMVLGRLSGADIVLDFAPGNGEVVLEAAAHVAAVFVVGVSPEGVTRLGQRVTARLGARAIAAILPAPINDPASLRGFLGALPPSTRVVVHAAPGQLPELLLGLAPCAARRQLEGICLAAAPDAAGWDGAALVLSALALTPCAIAPGDAPLAPHPVSLPHPGAVVALPQALVGRSPAPPPPEAVTTAEARHKAAPRDLDALLALLDVLRRRGWRGRAREVALERFAGGDWEAPAVAHPLGTALMEFGAATQAIACFRAILAATPGDPTVTARLAGALTQVGRAEEAWPLLEPLLRQPRVTINLLLAGSMVRRALGDLEGSLQWTTRLARQAPAEWRGEFERAFTLLLRGDFAHGWQAYEARPTPVAPNVARRWKGEPLSGGTVFVQGEQGIGDLMQFVRFLPALHAAGAGRVLVEAPAETVTLLAANGFEAVPSGLHPVADWCIPLLSLPHALRIGNALGGELVPYLRAPAPMEPLPLPPSRPGVRRLGIVWAGNPLFPSTATRDFDPACLPALAEIPGVEWVVLQHGESARQAPASMHRPPLPASWAGTAQWLAQLDGLVTIDSGIAHLAGAMGRPTWLLLPHVAEWRWGLSGDRTPWYPTMQLLRQARWRDWASVVPPLAAALASTSLVPAPDGR
jgi:Flp pilus assembly protein TadD